MPNGSLGASLLGNFLSGRDMDKNKGKDRSYGV